MGDRPRHSFSDRDRDRRDYDRDDRRDRDSHRERDRDRDHRDKRSTNGRDYDTSQQSSRHRPDGDSYSKRGSRRDGPRTDRYPEDSSTRELSSRRDESRRPSSRYDDRRRDEGSSSRHRDEGSSRLRDEMDVDARSSSQPRTPGERVGSPITEDGVRSNSNPPVMDGIPTSQRSDSMHTDAKNHDAPSSCSTSQVKSSKRKSSSSRADGPSVRQEPAPVVKDPELDAYEEKVRQRKERLEQWRREREAQKAESESASAVAASSASAMQQDEEEANSKRKAWNLEDDDEDDEDATSRLASPSVNGLPMAPVLKSLATTPILSRASSPQLRAQSPVAASPVQLPVSTKPVVNKPISRIIGKPVKGSITFKSPMASSKPTIIKPKVSLDDDDEDDVLSGLSSRRAKKLPRLDETPVAVKMDVDNQEDVTDALETYMEDVHKDVAKVVEEENAKAIASKGTAVDDATTVAEGETNNDNDEEEEAESSDDDIMGRVRKQLASKKKDFAQVNHSLMNYEEIRKDFFVEPPDLAAMTPGEVELLRAELDGIKIRGVNPPKPVVKWTQFGLPSVVFNVVTRSLKYEKPSPIQAQSIPAIMSGRDVIGIAKTGSGKTMAFLLPLFRHIKDQRPLEQGDGPIALIMTPTRELAVQIYKDAKHITKVMDLRAVCAYGGSPIKDQIAELKRGAEIIICTPGRMIDLLTANSGRVTNLKRVTYLVLDEADRMFDMGFEPQVMKIVNNVRPGRQTVLFSATFPRQMEALARKILTKPLEIVVGGRSVVSKDVTQNVEVLEEDDKFVRLLDILGRQAALDADAKSLIFVNQHDAADNLYRDLMKRGYPCLSLHGGKDQQDRDSTIADFKAGDVNIMIATSVAARGLDVKNLTLVINYECPNHMEDYVHRCGRTGRAGNKGEAYTFITPQQDRYAVDIVKALKMSGATIPEAAQKLSDEFMAKVKDGKATFTASGFGGKGLEKLDKERDQVKKMQKREHGGEEAADDDDEETDEEDIFEDDGDFKFRSRPVGKSAIVEAMKKEQLSGSPQPPVVTPAIPVISNAGLETGLRPEVQATITAADTPDEARRKAAAIAQRLAARAILNDSGKKGTRPGEPEAAFAMEIEINDFPQKARWKVTNKENISQIVERTGAAITTRGLYFAPGTNPGPNDRKLYLLIEGPDEHTLSLARKEIRRTLEEATAMALEHEEKDPQRGKFRITF
ncbi:hypothetical protein SmJEL517_g05130 [Synchytrium microbalum]|uniref:RNA helicase n=1 Tax=Synchytrium microbalum TaxID=1806994 RepID=A0A507BWH4_9FUNG|nr:uncharacterized protein SmJEL517_g05130 [Synchytrium microbalum]TPX31518.1 hypothetical protein SmJEL517_g05130 [Synchytrium microbalum]